MEKNSKIYVAGHSGIVGSALIKKLQSEGYSNIITRSHNELDLTRQAETESFFETEKPEYVFLLAARVGGIADNREHLADALYVNTQIELNVIKAAYETGVKKLLFTASSTVYPEVSAQPMSEDLLLSGPMEYSLGGYSLAKAVGIRLCEYYITQYSTEYIAAVLPNLYGFGDKNSTVLPMLIGKFYSAVKNNLSTVDVWGTGNARREFLHADDLADALLFLMKNYEGKKHINAGYGSDVSIRELAEIIKRVSGFSGEIVFDPTKPEGTKQKLLDSTRFFEMGWRPKISLEDGIREVYNKYKEAQNS
jgi:GDP-L-fucose synthase